VAGARRPFSQVVDPLRVKPGLQTKSQLSPLAKGPTHAAAKPFSGAGGVPQERLALPESPFEHPIPPRTKIKKRISTASSSIRIKLYLSV